MSVIYTTSQLIKMYPSYDDIQHFLIWHNNAIGNGPIWAILSELQIKGGIDDNSKIIFLISQNENLCCDPSLDHLTEMVLMRGLNMFSLK